MTTRTFDVTDYTFERYLFTLEQYYYDTQAKIALLRSMPIDKRNDQGETLLHVCVRHRSFLIEDVLDRIPDINATDNNGDTALNLAINLESNFSVGKLLDYGAKLNSNKNGITTLDILHNRMDFISQENIQRLLDLVPVQYGQPCVSKVSSKPKVKSCDCSIC